MEELEEGEELVAVMDKGTGMVWVGKLLVSVDRSSPSGLMVFLSLVCSFGIGRGISALHCCSKAAFAAFHDLDMVRMEGELRRRRRRRIRKRMKKKGGRICHS